LSAQAIAKLVRAFFMNGARDATAMMDQVVQSARR
jgi:hypothetical protein